MQPFICITLCWFGYAFHCLFRWANKPIDEIGKYYRIYYSSQQTGKSNEEKKKQLLITRQWKIINPGTRKILDAFFYNLWTYILKNMHENRIEKEIKRIHNFDISYLFILLRLFTRFLCTFFVFVVSVRLISYIS